MSGRDVLHPVQLAMFATGSEIKDMATDSYDRQLTRASIADPPVMEDMDQMWSRKETEAREPGWSHGRGVYDSMKKNGYVGGGRELDKVALHHGSGVIMGDGHHRVAAAAALEKEGQQTWVPLSHYDPDQQQRQSKYFRQRRPDPEEAKREATRKEAENWG